mmetsp:Transcript_5885/g.7637  ORF Transcript_5885/g.7637 Transcript_5885/m.7637 type:complete len:109 (+) Transcript_5885:13-339(+)
MAQEIIVGDTIVASSYLRQKLQARANQLDTMGRGEGGVLGPPPPTEAISTGSGTILDDPDMLWCEDVWSDEKEAIAKEKLANQGDVIWSTMVDRYEREARKSWDMFYR